MSAFTSPTSWTTAQSLSGANEIVLAYSERRQALGASAVSNLSSGANAQDKTLWLAMQQWLESNCTSFVDHVSGPLNSGSTDILYFTLATWRSAAGLNASGFRRSTDGVNFSYGKIQAGDVRGPWVFEDLQKGFAALKWVVSSGAVTTTGNYLYEGYGSAFPDRSWGNTYAEYAADWGALANYDTYIYKRVQAFHSYGEDLYGNPAEDTWIYGHAQKGIVIANINAFLSGTVDLYIKATGYDSFDAGGTGLLENKFKFVETSAIASSWSSSLIGNTGLPDVSDPGYGPCEMTESGYQCVSGYSDAGFTVSDNHMIIKYDFTNS